MSVANATVLRLTRELAFIDEVLAAAAAGKLRSKASSHFVDRCRLSFDAVLKSRARSLSHYCHILSSLYFSHLWRPNNSGLGPKPCPLAVC